MIKGLLKQSWQIAWHHPVLWFFGLCNIFLVGNEINLVINSFNRFGRNIETISKINGTEPIITNFEFIKNFFSQSSLVNLLIFIIPATILFCLAVIAQLILINGIKMAKDNQAVTLSQIFHLSGRQFWSVFFLNLINPLIIYILLAAFSLPFNHLYQKSTHLAWLIVYSILDLIIFIPLSFFLALVARFAIFDLIVYQNKFIAAVKNGFSFFIKNWLKTIQLIITLALIGLIAGLGLFLLTSTSSLPFIIFAFIFLKFKILSGFWFILSLALIIVLILLFFIGSIFSTFQSVVWVLFYLEKLGKKSE